MQHILIATVIKEFIVPLFMSKREEPKKVAKGKKPKVVKEIAQEYQFSPTRSAVIGALAALAAVLFDAGYISVGTQECLTNEIAEDISKQIEK
jgi:hypothetical protein